jgi:hypothetical protein
MAYDHSMYLEAQVAPGITIERIAEALEPLMAYLGLHGPAAFAKRYSDMDQHNFSFDANTGGLSVTTGGEVGYGYLDLVEEVAGRLGPITAEAGEIRLKDLDSPNPEDAISIIEFGPSADAIKQYVAKRDIEAGLNLIAPHLPENVMLELRRITSRECACYQQ